MLSYSPISKYSKFPGETQDVFSNFFLVPIPQQQQQPSVQVVRGYPYNTYQSYSYTKDNLRYVMNHAGSMVSGRREEREERGREGNSHVSVWINSSLFSSTRTCPC